MFTFCVYSCTIPFYENSKIHFDAILPMPCKTSNFKKTRWNRFQNSLALNYENEGDGRGERTNEQMNERTTKQTNEQKN